VHFAPPGRPEGRMSLDANVSGSIDCCAPSTTTGVQTSESVERPRRTFRRRVAIVGGVTCSGEREIGAVLCAISAREVLGWAAYCGHWF
jgi:hypothetical protein